MCEQPEVASFGRVRAERVVEPNLVEEHQVAEQRVVMRRTEIVGRRRDKEYFGPFLVYWGLNAQRR